MPEVGGPQGGRWSEETGGWEPEALNGKAGMKWRSGEHDCRMDALWDFFRCLKIGVCK